jgi:hypothetical protein
MSMRKYIFIIQYPALLHVEIKATIYKATFKEEPTGCKQILEQYSILNPAPANFQ